MQLENEVNVACLLKIFSNSGAECRKLANAPALAKRLELWSNLLEIVHAQRIRKASVWFVCWIRKEATFVSLS